MKKDFYEQQNDRSQHNSRKPYSRKPNYQKPSKGLLLLKSTVVALFITLTVLVIAFVAIKAKGGKNFLANFAQEKCAESSAIKIPAHIEKMELKDKIITVLTKADKSNLQEIIRIDATCGTELNRISFKISEEKND